MTLFPNARAKAIATQVGQADVLGLVTGRYLDAYRCGADTQSRRPKRSLVLALGTLILNGKLPKTRNETYDGDFPVLAIGNMPDLRELWGLGQSW